MKRIDIGWYQYKGYDIYEAIHPKLYGKYEIYSNTKEGEFFIDRTRCLLEAKILIDKKEENVNNEIHQTENGSCRKKTSRLV